MSNKLYFIALTGFLLIFLAGCQTEKKSERDYPQIRTLPVDKITPEGARFNAAIISGSAESITEHGFVWGRYDYLTINNSEKISIEDSPSTDQFSSDITSALEEMKEYFVRSYVKAGDLVIYGDPVKFTSLGSMAPEIIDFEPKSATWGDTISISGKNFSSQPFSNTVHFGTLIGVIVSSTNESIKVKVPNVTSQFSELSVEVIGNRATAGKLFELVTPGKITATNKNAVSWGDTLELEGIFPYSDHQLGVYVESTVATVLNITATRITVVMPNSIPYKDSVLIGLSIDYFKLDYLHKLHLKKPVLTSILPAIFGWGDTIQLIGVFNPLTINNFVYFSGIQARILESSNTKIKCAIPNINGHVATLSFKVSNYTFNYNTDISLSGPIIISIEPAKVSSNNFIDIRGKYFNGDNTTLKINNILCGCTIYPDHITTIVPDTKNGMATVEIDVYNKNVINSNLLEVSNPEITDFNPKSGVVGDIVTITGVGFDPNNLVVTMGGGTASVLEASATQIKINVPKDAPADGRITVNTYGAYAISTQMFHLLSPKILSIEPLLAKPGATITIKGENFNPELINVNIGYITAEITSVSPSEIQFILPDQPQGNYAVSVNTYAYYITSVENITYQTPWGIVRVMPKTPNSGMGVILAGEIFVFGGFNSQYSYITYLITGGSASEGITCPNPDEIEGVAFNVSDFGYLGLGRLQIDGAYSKDLYRFNPNNRTWASVKRFPGAARSMSFYFSIGSKCFLGGGSNQGTIYNDFWVYDASTDSWSPSGTYPGGNTEMAYAQVANGKGYIVDGNQLWEYTSESNSWLKKADFPGPARNKGCGFVINNVIYFGTGFNATGVLDDFWKYDPSVNQWQKLTNYPYKSFGSYGGSYNGNGYMGGGFGDNYRYWDETNLLRYIPENE